MSRGFARSGTRRHALSRRWSCRPLLGSPEPLLGSRRPRTGRPAEDPAENAADNGASTRSAAPGSATVTSPSQHVVLAATDSQPYASLRSRATPRKERYALGRALRKEVPRSRLGEWEAPSGRRPPGDQGGPPHG